MEIGFTFITGPDVLSTLKRASAQWRGQRDFFSLFADSYEVNGELVSGKFVVGSLSWLRDGKAARLVLQHRQKFAILIATYVKSEEFRVEGEVCTDVERLGAGECKRLSYEVYCRYCRSADRKRYERCWAEAETDDRQVKAALEKLGLRYSYGRYESAPLDRRQAEELAKVLKSICG